MVADHLHLRDLADYASDMESDNPSFPTTPSANFQALFQALNALHVFDRPVDITSLHTVVHGAWNYALSLHGGGPVNVQLEASFLRPLLREVLPSVFARLLNPDLAHAKWDLRRAHDALNCAVTFSSAASMLMRSRWEAASTGDAASPLSQALPPAEARRDLASLLFLLGSCLFAPHNPLNGLAYPTYPQLAEPRWCLVPAASDGGADAAAPVSLCGAAALLNAFGTQGGFDVLLRMLRSPEACGTEVLYHGTIVLKNASYRLIPTHYPHVLESIQAITAYISGCFAAAEDLSALADEGGGGGEGLAGHALATRLSQILGALADVTGCVAGFQTERELVGPLQREFTLRLLRSGHFTRQLLAVKELYGLLDRARRSDRRAAVEAAAAAAAMAADASAPAAGDEADLATPAEELIGPQTLEEATMQASNSPMIGPAPAPAPAPTSAPPPVPPPPPPPPHLAVAVSDLLAWIARERLVTTLLASNLHQQQYAEALQRLLAPLAAHGAVTSDHLSRLWHLVEDSATFEDIKSNVCAVLGAVTPHLPPEERSAVLSRAAALAAAPAPGAIPLALRLLESISLDDTASVMADDVLNTVADVVLRPEAPAAAATSGALVAAVCRYAPAARDGSGGCESLRLAVDRCVDALNTTGSRAAAAHQLLRLLREAVPAYCPKDPAQKAFYEELTGPDAPGPLALEIMDAYEAFRDDQREAMAAAGGGTGGDGMPPSSGCFSHSTVVSTFHQLVYHAFDKHTYLIGLEPMLRVLRWATEGGAAPTDAAASWALLLAAATDDPKLIGEKTIGKMLKNAVCSLSASHITWPAWRCITAYMALLGGAEVREGPNEGRPDYADKVTLSSKIAEFLEPWRELLARTAAEAPDAAVAARAGGLLARLVACDAGAVLSTEDHGALMGAELTQWQERLGQAATALCGRSPAAWHDGPALVAGLDPGTAYGHVIAAQRCLDMLVWLVKAGRKNALPSRLPHAAAYAGERITLTLVLPQGVTVNTPHGSSNRLTVHMPRNSCVGAVRRWAAARARALIPGPAPSPAQIRLVSAGHPWQDDGAMLSELPGGGQVPIHLAWASPANQQWDVAPAERAALDAASPAAALAASAGLPDGRDVYALALAMEGLQLPGELESGTTLRTAAAALLEALPTSTAAVADVEAWLQQDDARAAIAGTLTAPATSGGAAAAAVPKGAVLRYAAETLCALARPAKNPLESGQAGEDDALATELRRAQLVPSGVLPALLALAAAAPGMGGATGAPRLHRPLLLLAQEVADELLRSASHAEVRAMTEGGSEGGDEAAAGVQAETDAAAEAAVAPIVRYAINVLAAALRTPPWAEGQSGTGTLTSPVATAAAAAAGPSLVLRGSAAADAEALCGQALTLLQTCFSAVPSVAAAETAAAAPAPGGSDLASVILALLAHHSEDLRHAAVNWCTTFVRGAAGSRGWAFTRLLTPLLLAEAANAEQLTLVNAFLAELEPEQTDAAQQVLDQLVQRILAAAEDCGSGGRGTGDITATLGHALSLVRCLRAYDVGENNGLVDKLINGVLFPELKALPADDDSPLPAPALFAAHSHAVAAARRSDACRHACLDLLLALMSHDRQAWDAGAAALSSALTAGAATLPSPYRNDAGPGLRPAGSLCGLANGGATCYMNATFQQLFMQPAVRRLILSAPAVAPADQADSVFHHVQSMFAHLTAGIASFYRPNGFWNAFKDYEGRPVNIREHQDAYEFFTRLQDAVDEHLRAAGHPRAIYAALGGSFAQLIYVAGRPELRSERREEFYQISLDVRGKAGLLESLESYVAVELMNGDNQWLCEDLGKKVDAEKRTLLADLPPTLMLHLKRFEWDYETFTRWKVKDRFEFPQRLDMRPFTMEGAGAPGAPAPRPAAYYEYELRGIVVHSGTAFAGHYYSYVKDRTTGEWYCFDDTAVEAWDPAGVEADCFGGRYQPEGSNQEYDRPNSAYMLLYERVQAVDLEDAAGAAVAGAGAKGAVMAEKKGSESAVAAAALAAMEVESPAKPQAMEGDPLPATAASAVAAAAGPGADQGLNPMLQEALAADNLRSIAAGHLFSPDLLDFFAELAGQVRDGAKTGPGGGGASRKARRRVDAASPAASRPFLAAAADNDSDDGEGLARLASRRDGDLSDLLYRGTSLCRRYLCQIAARGPLNLANDLGAAAKAAGTSQNRKESPLVAALHQAIRADIAAALGLLDVQTNGPYDIDHALGCISKRPREAASLLLTGAAYCIVKSTVGRHLGATAQNSVLCPVFERIFESVDSHLPRIAAQKIFSSWEMRLEALEALVRTMPSLAAPQEVLEDILRLGDAVTKGFWDTQEESWEHCYFARSYIAMLSIAVRRYDPLGDVEGRGVNPYCLTSAENDDMSAPPLPPGIRAVLFGNNNAERMVQLWMPGAMSSDEASALLRWMWHENNVYHDLMAAAMSAHLNETAFEDFPELLAAELPTLAEALATPDSLQSNRYSDALLGLGPNAPGPGLLELVEPNTRPTAHAVLVIRLAVALWEANKEEFFEIVSDDRAGEWARDALDVVDSYRQMVAADVKERDRWSDISRAPVEHEDMLDLDMIVDSLDQICYEVGAVGAVGAAGGGGFGGGGGGGAGLAYDDGNYGAGLVRSGYLGGGLQEPHRPWGAQDSDTALGPVVAVGGDAEEDAGAAGADGSNAEIGPGFGMINMLGVAAAATEEEGPRGLGAPPLRVAPSAAPPTAGSQPQADISAAPHGREDEDDVVAEIDLEDTEPGEAPGSGAGGGGGGGVEP